MPALSGAANARAGRRPGSAGACTPRRRGFTLVELVVALAVASIVCAAVAGLLVRQQRFYRRAAAAAAGRDQVEQAMAVLPSDLRAVAPAQGDVTTLAADSAQFRVTIAAGVACGAPDSLALELPPRARGAAALFAWSAAPRAGDTLLVYAPGDSTRPGEWSAHAVAALDAGAGYCAGSPLVSAADAGAPRFRLRVAAAAPLPSAAGAGSGVRVLRHVRYKLYQAGDGRWYLGQSEYQAPSGWATVQPVSGPYAGPGRTSLGATPFFRYYDAAGAELTDAGRARLARVTVTARPAPAPPEGAAPAESLDVAARAPNA